MFSLQMIYKNIFRVKIKKIAEYNHNVFCCYCFDNSSALFMEIRFPL